MIGWAYLTVASGIFALIAAWFQLLQPAMARAAEPPVMARASEQPAPAIDPRITAPALEMMAATIKLRDAQLGVMSEQIKKLEAELKDAQAKAAPPPAPPAESSDTSPNTAVGPLGTPPRLVPGK